MYEDHHNKPKMLTPITNLQQLKVALLSKTNVTDMVTPIDKNIAEKVRYFHFVG